MATILIVEDTPANMKLATLLLEGAGHQVLQATDASSGLELVRMRRPDLILMDIQLPGMDGITAVGLLKADPDTAAIKVLALTAFAMKGDEQRMIDAGFDGYVAKPIRHKLLLDTIQELLAT